jgi:hypothetical protein
LHLKHFHSWPLSRWRSRWKQKDIMKNVVVLYFVTSKIIFVAMNGHNL